MLKLLKATGILLTVILTYLLAGAFLLNNASAAYFPRQLVVIFLTTVAGSLAAAVLWRLPHLLIVAGLSMLAAAAMWHPDLQVQRLGLLANAVPLAGEKGSPSHLARCFCTTRASLLELFGAPDFISDGVRGTATVYAYALNSGNLVLYEFVGNGGAEDQVIRIREELAAPERLGLVPWTSSR